MESTETTATPADVSALRLFQPREVVAAFSADFLDPDRCAEFVLSRIHPDGARCPRCGEVLEGRSLDRFRSFGRVHCRGCGKYFTATTGTALRKVKLSPRQVVLLAYLLGLGLDQARIAEEVGVEAETVRLWSLKFDALGGGA